MDAKELSKVMSELGKKSWKKNEAKRRKQLKKNVVAYWKKRKEEERVRNKKGNKRIQG